MNVEETYSIDELYQKVEDYDIVFTSEASLADGLNNRLDEPMLGEFATTPLTYTFSRFQNIELKQERGIFLEVIEKTDLSWKKASYILENMVDCWRETGSPENILKYEVVDDKDARKVLDIISSTENVFDKMTEVEIKEQDVAVVNPHQFDELDREVLPEDYDEIEVFKEEQNELSEFKIFDSTTEIIEALRQNIDEENMQDVAIVNDRSSEYAVLVESMLESEGIPMMVQENVSEDEDFRSFLRFARLSLDTENLLVGECQSVLREIGIELDVKLNNDYISDIDHEEAEEFLELLDEAKNSSIEYAADIYEQKTGKEVKEDLQELNVLSEQVSFETLNRLEYFLDTYDLEGDSNGTGVLLADAKSSAYVDRPIVFYLGMDSSWIKSRKEKPWTDSERHEETEVKDFETLLQNGEQQHFLVQEEKLNRQVTPCLYFSEITSQEYESFTHFEHVRKGSNIERNLEGFESKDLRVQNNEKMLFSQSALNSFVESPRDYMFDRLAKSTDEDYFRKGTLFHDFAEFYVNHAEYVDENREEIKNLMIEEMASIVDSLEIDELERELQVGIENIIEYLDSRDIEKRGIDGYTQREDKENFFSVRTGKEIHEEVTEAWFETPEIHAKGEADLLASSKEIIDYKKGNRKSANSKVKKSNLELLEDSANFQAILYLLQLRETNPGQKLSFKFFHFLDNIEDKIEGSAELQDNIVEINYYPCNFNEFLGERELFNYIITNGRTGELLSENNDRRKTLEVRAEFEHFNEFFKDCEMPEQYDKEEIEDSEILEDMIKFYADKIGGRHNYVEDGCQDALEKIIDFRKKNYFKEDLDRFEDFLEDQVRQRQGGVQRRQLPFHRPFQQ